MRKLRNEIKIDRFKESVENALGMRVKKLREMAATAGIGALYGLLFAGLLFAPLLSHIEAQSNSPTNNSSTNNVLIPTDYPTGLGAFDDAYSRTDCHIIWMRVRMKKQDYFDELLEPHRTAYKAAPAKCDEKKARAGPKQTSASSCYH